MVQALGRCHLRLYIYPPKQARQLTFASSTSSTYLPTDIFSFSYIQFPVRDVPSRPAAYLFAGSPSSWSHLSIINQIYNVFFISCHVQINLVPLFFFFGGWGVWYAELSLQINPPLLFSSLLLAQQLCSASPLERWNNVAVAIKHPRGWGVGVFFSPRSKTEAVIAKNKLGRGGEEGHTRPHLYPSFFEHKEQCPAFPASKGAVAYKPGAGKAWRGLAMIGA